MSFFIFKRC